MTDNFKFQRCIENLEKYAALIQAVNEHVRRKYLTAYSMPNWVLPEDQVSGRLGKFLHRIYQSKELEAIFPACILLTISLCFSLLFEPLYTLFLVLLPSDFFPIPILTWDAVWSLLFAVGIILLLVVPALYGLVGAYWTLIELIINRNLDARAKYFTLAVTFTLIIFWLLVGAPIVGQDIVIQDADYMTRMVLTIRQTSIYTIIVALIVYIPAISHAGLWVTRIAISLKNGGRSALHWILSYHVMQPFKSIQQFVVEKLLPVDHEGNLQSLLELEEKDIDFLFEWATQRRELVQNRLLPTTLILATMGLIANTFLGDAAVRGVVNLFKESFLAPIASSFQGFGSILDMTGRIFIITILVIVVYLPIMLIIQLLNESYVMGFIAQACLQVKHVKRATRVYSTYEIEKVVCMDRLGWLKRLIRFLRKVI